MFDERELEAPPQRMPLPAAIKPDTVYLWLAAASALGVIIGAVGPWASAWGVVQLSGTEMHGWREVAIGVIALALLAVFRWRGGALVLVLVAVDGWIGAAGATSAIAKINEHATLTILGFRYTFLTPAWGLYLVFGASLALACCASALAWRTRRAAVLLRRYAQDCP
jgi:hypothetical protein